MLFVVVPVGGKWGVCSGGEVIATAGSPEAAWDLAEKAGKALRPAAKADATRVSARAEPRSFRNED
jgi:hypothetical protein